MQTIIKYKCNDGLEFETEQKALEWEAILVFHKSIGTLEYSPSHLAKGILANREAVLKLLRDTDPNGNLPAKQSEPIIPPTAHNSHVYDPTISSSSREYQAASQSSSDAPGAEENPSNYYDQIRREQREIEAFNSTIPTALYNPINTEKKSVF